MTVMTATDLQDFLAREFPQVSGLNLRIEEVRDRYVRVRMPFDDQHLRPGGTVSGPAMMTVADCSVYLAILATLGGVAQAVTTNLNANFLSRPEPKDIVAEARIIKLGRRLAFGEVDIFSDGIEEPVAHVTATYAIPDVGREATES